jgi:glutamate formiminotransferase
VQRIVVQRIVVQRIVVQRIVVQRTDVQRQLAEQAVCPMCTHVRIYSACSELTKMSNKQTLLALRAHIGQHVEVGAARKAPSISASSKTCNPASRCSMLANSRACNSTNNSNFGQSAKQTQITRISSTSSARCNQNSDQPVLRQHVKKNKHARRLTSGRPERLHSQLAIISILANSTAGK